jgi:hypothetical protein
MQELAFGLGVLHVVGQLAGVQQHCGGGSCAVVTLSVRWCLPLGLPFSGGSLQWFRYKHECGCGWSSRSSFLSSVVVL